MIRVTVVLDKKEYSTMIGGNYNDAKKKVENKMGDNSFWISIGSIIARKELIDCIQFAEIMQKGCGK